VEVTLVVVQPDGQTRSVTMKRARLLIGRKPECDIRIPVSSVSREHCELRIEGGKLLAKDMGSSNGTYVNRERIQETELSAGQLLAVGPAVFVVRIDGEPEAVDGKKAYAQGSAPEPVGASGAPGSRPAAPGGAKPAKPAKAAAPQAPKPASKPAAKPDDDDDDDLDLRSPDDSSVSDFDFDFLDDEEDKKQPGL
jgi:predicted component of type VI protein secretion system